VGICYSGFAAEGLEPPFLARAPKPLPPPPTHAEGRPPGWLISHNLQGKHFCRTSWFDNALEN
jgi:hypothetical protein